MHKPAKRQLFSKLPLLAAAAAVAAVTAIGAAVTAPGTGAAATALTPHDGVTLVWGTGEAPTYVSSPSTPVAGEAKPGDIELVWGRGGPPRYVAVG